MTQRRRLGLRLSSRLRASRLRLRRGSGIPLRRRAAFFVDRCTRESPRANDPLRARSSRSASNLATSKRRPASHLERRTTRALERRTVKGESRTPPGRAPLRMAWPLRPANRASSSLPIGAVPRMLLRTKATSRLRTDPPSRSVGPKRKSAASRSRTASRGDASDPLLSAMRSKASAVIILPPLARLSAANSSTAPSPSELASAANRSTSFSLPSSASRPSNASNRLCLARSGSDRSCKHVTPDAIEIGFRDALFAQASHQAANETIDSVLKSCRGHNDGHDPRYRNGLASTWADGFATRTVLTPSEKIVRFGQA